MADEQIQLATIKWQWTRIRFRNEIRGCPEDAVSFRDTETVHYSKNPPGNGSDIINLSLELRVSGEATREKALTLARVSR